MPTVRLTKSAIEKLHVAAPTGEQVLVWDRDQPGFGVRVSAVTRGDVAFIAQGRVRGGPQRRVTIGPVADWFAGGRTLDDARAEAARLRLMMLEGRDPKARAAPGLTLRQALDEYLKRRVNLADRSRTHYRATIERWFAAWLDRPLRAIDADAIERRYHAIAAEVAARKKKKGAKRRPSLFVSEPGAAVANLALRGLRAVWRFAAERDPDLPPWPTARLRGGWFHVGRRERHVRADDLKKFFATVDERDAEGKYLLGRDMRDLVALILFTGFRRGEACALRWEHVDFAAGVIRLPAKATKSRRALDLPMSDLVRELLTARREIGTEGPWVFAGSGESGHVEEPKRAFEALTDKLGIAVNAHALRSTYITVVNGTPGVTPLQARALVNHALDVADVHTGYVGEVDLRTAAQAVALRLGALCGIRASKKPRNRRQ